MKGKVGSRFRFSRWMQSAGGYSPVKILGFLFHLPNFVRLCVRLMQDPRVPFTRKLLCYGAIIYFFMPIDLIRDYPNFIFGHIDDIVILFLAFRKLIQDSPPEVVEEHVEAISEGRIGG